MTGREAPRLPQAEPSSAMQSPSEDARAIDVTLAPGLGMF